MNRFGERIRTSNKPRNIRENNLRLVLQLFRQHGILSIHEIAGMAALSKTTVTKVVAMLVDRGLVISAGKGASTEEGGKKPELYTLNARKACVISIITDGDRLAGAVLDLKCGMLHRDERRWTHRPGYRDTLERAADLITGMMDALGLAPRDVCGIALVAEGVVDAEKGIIRIPIQHDWWGRDLPIAEDLLGILPFDAPVWVDNSCRFLGYAEVLAREEAASGCTVTLFSTGGTGACIIRDGRIMMGENGFIGELGHMVIDAHSDVRCQCGAVGCFEALVSPRRVLDMVRRDPGLADSALGAVPPADLAMDDIFAAAEEGDPLARRTLDEAAGCFAALIHNIVITHDPRRIILQGLYARAGGYFLEQLREKVRASRFFSIPNPLEIVYTRLQSDRDHVTAFLMGGGYFAAEMYFSHYDFHTAEQAEESPCPQR